MKIKKLLREWSRYASSKKTQDWGKERGGARRGISEKKKPKPTRAQCGLCYQMHAGGLLRLHMHTRLPAPFLKTD